MGQEDLCGSENLGPHHMATRQLAVTVGEKTVDVEHRVSVLQIPEFPHQRDNIALDAHQFKGSLYFDFVQVFCRSNRYTETRLRGYEDHFFQTPDAGEDNRPFPSLVLDCFGKHLEQIVAGVKTGQDHLAQIDLFEKARIPLG